MSNFTEVFGYNIVSVYKSLQYFYIVPLEWKVLPNLQEA